MGLFNRFKRKKEDMFENWLNDVLKDNLSDNIVAINFNLYEDENDKWSIELVGTSSFDENDEDWACDEVFTTRDNPYVLEMKSDWEGIQGIFIDKINNYLDNGKYADKLKHYKAVAIGFVDGDLSIIYKK